MAESDVAQGVAVIGMAGRFPGARNVSEFWDNLCQGRDTISHFDLEQLEVRPDPDSPDASAVFVPARGILEDVDEFDARFFGYYPREAALMDPQHRVFLEIAWEALEHAGHDPYRYPGPIGVYAGCYLDTYLLANICAAPGQLQHLIDSIQVGSLATELGNDKDYLATRVAYKLNLRGPAVTVQTACSTSLVAIAQACQGLLSFQCDMALAGGVTIALPQRKGYFHKEGGMTSADGRCRTFDADAQGTVFSNGAAVVTLKRLEDAIAERDTIYAVIKGSATNNDGSAKVSYTAPSVDGQAEVIALAQALAEVDPRTIQYVETHGTATPLGDPIEIAALTQAFRRKTEATGFCAVGSVKTNIGHLDCASGAAGLIKTALALHHDLIPPSLHFERPNPRIEFERTPFYVHTELGPWPAAEHPRRAGISSFGVGGTNAHLVLEEAPRAPPSDPGPGHWLLPVSAKSPAALAALCGSLADALAAGTDLSTADVAFTLQAGRAQFEHRDFVVADGTEAAGAAFARLAERSRSRHRYRGRLPKIVFTFPGQGAQFPGMTRQLYDHEPRYRAELDRCAAILERDCGLNLFDVMFPAERNDETARELARTGHAQPAIFSCEFALAQTWRDYGIEPSALVGHSVGEFAAACVAGVMSLEDALALVVARGRHMEAMEPGSMLSLRVDETQAQGLLGERIELAAVNAPQLVVLSGPTEDIAALKDRLEGEGQAATLLHTSHAFHSWMMDGAVERTVEDAAGIALSAPAIPICSTVDGAWLGDETALDPAYWGGQLRRPVRFADAIETLAGDGECLLLECGPGQTLTTLARQSVPDRKRWPCVASLGHAHDESADRTHFLSALGLTWTRGAELAWERLAGDARRVPLPAYPFQRQRHWIDPGAAAAETAAAERSLGGHADEPLETMLERQIALLERQLELLDP